jgi:hypothetical protein
VVPADGLADVRRREGACDADQRGDDEAAGVAARRQELGDDPDDEPMMMVQMMCMALLRRRQAVRACIRPALCADALLRQCGRRPARTLIA